MKYELLPKSQLIKRIKHLEDINQQLLVKLKKTTFKCLGHWNVEISTKTINYFYFDNIETKCLQFNDLPNIIHPDDFNEIKILFDDCCDRKYYELEFRIKINDEWKKIYLIGKVTDQNDVSKKLSGYFFQLIEYEPYMHHYDNNLDLGLYDQITNTLNYQTIFNYLHLQIKETSITKSSLIIAIVDIDNFRKCPVNLQNNVLEMVSKTIKKYIPNHFQVGRIDNDVFLIIFPNTTYKEAFKTVDKIRKKISSLHVGDFRLTISAGVKDYAGCSLLELIHEADLNVYQAKKAGKNCVK